MRKPFGALLFSLVLTGMIPPALHADDFAGWLRQSTPHFIFIYEPRDQAAVTELASMAEGVYREITAFLDNYPKRVWVVVNGRVDEANGMSGGLPARIVLYLPSPSVPILGTREHDYLRMLLTHELTHYVHLGYNTGFFAVMSRVFGRGLKGLDSSFLPGWMIEGIATNTETLFTHGGRGRDPYFELIYRGLIYDQRFFSLDQAGYASAFPPRQRVYVGGYLMVHYLLDHFGDQVFTKIHRRYVRFPFLGPWAAIKRVTGLSASDLFARMVNDLRNRYVSDRSIPPGTRVTPDRIGSYYLPIPTKRGWIEYRTPLDSPPSIVRFDPDSHRQTVLLKTSLTDYSSLTATRDGQRVVFATLTGTVGRAGNEWTSDLFGIDTATRRTRRITRSADLWQPALSPDGTLLVAVQGEGPYSRLVLVDQRSGAVHPLVWVQSTSIQTPSFSPNGKLLAFTLNDHGRQRVYTLPVDAAFSAVRDAALRSPSKGLPGYVHALPDAPAANLYFPRFDSNDWVVFAADLGSGLALYETGVSGGPLYRIARDPVGASSGFVEGNRVIYTSFGAGGYLVRERPRHAVQIANPNLTTSAPQGPSLRPPAPITAPSPVTSPKPYRDWPVPLFWVPVPAYTYGSLQSLTFGLGLFTVGGSYLGRTAYSALVSLRPDVLQPALQLSLQSTIGTLTLGYSLSEGYSATSGGSATQSLSQAVGLSIPLLAKSLFDTTTNLSITPGLTDLLTVSRDSPFSPLDQARSPASFHTNHDMAVSLALNFSRYGPASGRDIYPPRLLKLSLTGRAYPPLLSGPTPGVTAILTGSLALPSLLPHQDLKLGFKNGYTTVTGATTPLINPRGVFPAGTKPTPLDRQTTPGRSLLSLDYQGTITLADEPLPFGFNWQGLGVGIHLAVAADWGLRSGVFRPDGSLYAGAELLTLIGYYGNVPPMPLTVGATLRLDPRFQRAFDPLHDIGLYFVIGSDSFSNASTNLTAAATALVRRSTPRAPSPRVPF